MPVPGTIDVRAVRRHFLFPGRGRIALNNAASTQPPRELLALFASLGPEYENVHRGQSSASAAMTARFEESYHTIARFIGASGPASIALYRNTTEAVNAVMYSLLTEFRDGDNVVTTLMEHNSNYVPWYAMCREILPRFGRRVQCRLARFDPVSGELDLDHLASLIDARTKLVCCTGASNFLGTRTPLAAVRTLADASGYFQPNGERRSWLLIDGAQLVPGSFTDVHALGADYLAFSFHKLLAPVPLLAGRAGTHARPRGTGMSAVTCPECGAAAEITERFTLASTDGPVAHVALSCAGGHHYRMTADRLPASAPRRLRVMLIPALTPHVFPVCIRCLVNPAGFWVSGKDSNVVRRPWCLSCCEDLDRERCDMIPFGA